MVSQSLSFKEFVKVKRELSQSRGENRKLRQQLRKQSSGKPKMIYLSVDTALC